jgi:lactate dehydrogenase-like 2-hydroxyacid dehydrogenase
LPYDIYVTRRIPQAGLEILKSECNVRLWDSDDPVPRAELESAVGGIEGLYCLLTESIDEALLQRAPRLRVISQMAVGYDNIDIDACSSRGIPVGHTPGVLTDTTADLTWALLMAAARRIAEADRYVRAGKWKTWGPMTLTGLDVHHATLGIVGFGRIGQAVARRAKGFDMRILYQDVIPPPQSVLDETGAQAVDLGTLLAVSDFVTLHTILSEETHHLIGEHALRKMKPTAVLINASRGPVVDNLALARALREGWIAYAALDVTEPEPVPLDSPLLELENCTIVPHIGSASIATRTLMATMAARNLVAGLRGEALPNCVNCGQLG